jgi:SnoaL-like domain
MDAALAGFLVEYMRCTNTHQFDLVAPLIAEDAIYWFTDGSYRGREAIRAAFERTWAVIQDEEYVIENLEWLTVDMRSAACVYSFRWQGRIDGVIHEGCGRGTTVLCKLNERWQVTHEHLSRWPG